MDNEKFQQLVLQQFDKVFGKLETMETRMDSLEKGQELLQQDVHGLHQGVQSLQQDVQELQQDVQGLQQDVQELQQGQLRIESRMENEIIEKIRALFDDRSVQMDYFASIRNSLARIEDRVEFLARQNIEHLDKMREHDREIRLLRSERGRER